MPWYCTVPTPKPMTVTSRMPSRIAPGKRRVASPVMMRKPSAASSVSVVWKLPSESSVAGWSTISQPLRSPIMPTKSPMPAPIAMRRFQGMLMSIHSLSLVTVKITNRMPAMNTAPSAVCHG